MPDPYALRSAPVDIALGEPYSGVSQYVSLVSMCASMRRLMYAFVEPGINGTVSRELF